MDNLNATSASHRDRDLVKSERDKMLSAIASLTHLLGSHPEHQKNDDYRVLERDLSQIRAEYIQSADDWIQAADHLEQVEQDNRQLKEANKVLANDVSAETQVFEQNQQEIATSLQQLAVEKEGLYQDLNTVKAAIAKQQAKNDALEQELNALKQAQPYPQVQDEAEQLQASLLSAQAEIADLFIHLKTSAPEKALDTVAAVVVTKNS
ncbi:hypothetical protein FACS1894193_00900 [Bacilli bacterium]|nr:hypothetical protein FACS1894192_00050 [Bacilli bacterium]GHU39809.1 hypothetical protein FACS1894193_00900 [Bacilli bacterium]